MKKKIDSKGKQRKEKIQKRIHKECMVNAEKNSSGYIMQRSDSNVCIYLIEFQFQFFASRVVESYALPKYKW